MTTKTQTNVPEDQSVLSVEEDSFRRALAASLVPRLKEMDLPRLVERFGSIEAVADRMLAAIPDTVVNDPPVGACHTRARLATWQGVSRQAVHMQQRSGRIIGFLHHGPILHPTVQFDSQGRPLPLLRDLLEAAEGPLDDADRIAHWLHDATGPNGTTRAEQLAAALAASDSHPLPTESLTFVRPPMMPDSPASKE